MLQSLVYNPLWDAIERYLGDPFLKDMEQFVGGGAGHDWVSKAARADQNKQLGPYLKLQRQFKEEPKMMEVVQDNILRLTALAGVERLLTLRQAYGGLKSRFTFVDSNTACLQKIFNQGVFTGYFRGALLNGFQFVSNWAHPLFYSQGNGYIAHFLCASVFEVATFPIDTVKTILYSDINGTYKGVFDIIQRVYERNGIQHFYAGFAHKLAFNGALIFHLRNIYEQDTYSQVLSFPLLAAAYGLLTFKTRLQIASTDLSFLEQNQRGKLIANVMAQKSPVSAFRGLVPFLVLTQFFHYNLYALYSKTAQESTLHAIMEEGSKNLRSPKEELVWS